MRITVGGLDAQLLSATGHSATFLVPTGLHPGPTTVTATNPGGRSGSIAFTALNHPPVAHAGPDQTVFVTNTVQLDGDPLTFHWTVVSAPAGSTATLSDPTAVRPTFRVDRPGTYVVQIIVNDGRIDSAPDTVQISTANSRPVANAGPDQTVHVGNLVSLDGSASSDVDGDPLTFQWAFVATPTDSQVALLDATTAYPSFVADLPGRYVVQLIVNDGTVDSKADTVQIDTYNSRPVADAGPDQQATVGATEYDLRCLRAFGDHHDRRRTGRPNHDPGLRRPELSALDHRSAGARDELHLRRGRPSPHPDPPRWPRDPDHLRRQWERHHPHPTQPPAASVHLHTR